MQIIQRGNLGRELRWSSRAAGECRVSTEGIYGLCRQNTFKVLTVYFLLGKNDELALLNGIALCVF